jgi:hypothetical protein
MKEIEVFWRGIEGKWARIRIDGKGVMADEG